MVKFERTADGQAVVVNDKLFGHLKRGVGFFNLGT